MTRPRILLADDHQLIAEGLSKLLKPDFDLIGIIQDGQTLLQKIETLAPDVVLLDISLPLLNGFDAARHIKKVAPNIKIIFLTMHAESAFLQDAMEVGGIGYVVKQSAASELVMAIREVLQGRKYISAVIDRNDAKCENGSTSTEQNFLPLNHLTSRQREVLQLVAEGYSNKEMANILNLSLKTIEYHKHRLMQALGLQSTAELTKYAMEHRMVPPSQFPS